MELSDRLIAARANLWKAQGRLGVKPHLYLSVNGSFTFNFKDPSCWTESCPEPYLKCTMKPDILRRILSRELHWNNAELACDILFDRRPNTFNPDVHTLMSFFHD